MSKNRIYKIKDKILVQGNENKLTENEILVKEENGSIVLKERVNGEVKSIAGSSGKNQLPIFSVQLNGDEVEQETSSILLGINNVNPQDYLGLDSFVLDIDGYVTMTAIKLGEGGDNVVYAAYSKMTSEDDPHLGLLTLIPSLSSFRIDMYV